MKIDLQLLLPILLQVTIALSLSLTLPDLDNDTSVVQVNSTQVGSEFSCTRGRRLSRRRPRFADCGGAIRQLSDNHAAGAFHTGGLLNPFQLPVTKWHHTCAVRISMKDGIKDDEGTWLSVSLAATQLNIVCVGTSAFPTYQGGYTTAGRYDGVKVSLVYCPPEGCSVQGVGNGTMLVNGTMTGDTS